MTQIDKVVVSAGARHNGSRARPVPAQAIPPDYDRDPKRFRLARAVSRRHANAADVHERVGRRLAAEDLRSRGLLGGGLTHPRRCSRGCASRTTRRTRPRFRSRTSLSARLPCCTFSTFSTTCRIPDSP
jgi:hypothetical protein